MDGDTAVTFILAKSSQLSLDPAVFYVLIHFFLHVNQMKKGFALLPQREKKIGYQGMKIHVPGVSAIVQIAELEAMFLITR